MNMEQFLQQAHKNLNKPGPKPKERTEKVEKVAVKTSKSAKNITLADVEVAYATTGYALMRRKAFFLEKNPLVQLLKISEDGKAATPLGALIEARKATLSEEERNTVFNRLLHEPNYKWTVGTMAQFLGLTAPYVQGFACGWDGQPPLHKNCSRDAHRGHQDGLQLFQQMQAVGRITVSDEDPFKDEHDPEILAELTRVLSYWRPEWGEYTEWVADRAQAILAYYADEEGSDEELGVASVETTG